MWQKAGKIAIIAGAGVLLAAQLIRPNRDNPFSDPASAFDAVVDPPRQLSAALQRSCGDCHSNETVWPWYSNIAPVSWLVAYDVKEGRARLNLSEWNRFGPNMSRSRVLDMCDEVSAGKMPLPAFTWIHPEARLNNTEIALLCSLPGTRTVRNREFGLIAASSQAKELTHYGNAEVE